MHLLEQIKKLFNKASQQQASTKEHTVAIGSEAMHDAGLTDEETAGADSFKKAGGKRDHYIKHNDLLPEEKITVKQKMKTPV